MKQIAIIADDLTGANDTGVQFCQQGLSTLVIIDSEKINLKEHTREVLAINANTRHLTASEAYQRVYNLSQSLKKANIDRIYKKIDSTLRGHPGAELEAVMDAWQAEMALVAPTFPVNRRVVRDGYLLVDFEETAIPDDFTQFSRCYVPAVLQQEMKHRVGSVNLEIIRRGYKELAATLVASAKESQVLVLDAVAEGDLQNIARAISHLPRNVVIAGAAGLAAHLAVAWNLKTLSKIPFGKEGIVLLVAGSRNPVTAVQVRMLTDAYKCQPLQVNTAAILAGEEEAEIERVLKLASDHLNNQRLLMIAVSSLFRQDSGSEGDKTAGKIIAAAIGTIVSSLVPAVEVKGLVVTGGDTALHVCRALGATGINLANELVPGIPMGYLAGGSRIKDLPIVTKAGGFGPPDAFIKIIQQLNQEGN